MQSGELINLGGLGEDKCIELDSSEYIDLESFVENKCIDWGEEIIPGGEGAETCRPHF